MRELYIEPYSEAEDYLVNRLSAVTKDKITVQLGAIWGRPYNTYIISDADYMRIRNYIKSKKES